MSSITISPTNDEAKSSESRVPLLCTQINKRRQAPCQFKRKHGCLCGVHFRVKQRLEQQAQNEECKRVQPGPSKTAPLTRKEIIEWTPKMKVTRIRLQNTLRGFGVRKKLHCVKDKLIEKFLNRVYYPVLHLSEIVRIQRWHRFHVHRMTMNLHGGDPYRMQRKCVNDSELVSLEDITDVPPEQFICYTTADNHTYGFTTESIRALYKQNWRPNNPYTREPLPLSFGDRADGLYIHQLNIPAHCRPRFVRYPLMSRIGHYSVPYRVCRWCEIIQSDTTFVIQPEWILKLSPHRLQQSYRALRRIWMYLSEEVRKEIHKDKWGRDLFNFSVTYDFRHARCRFDYIQILLSLFRNMTRTSSCRDDRERGVIITCAVLYITSRASRTALSWATDIHFEGWSTTTPPESATEPVSEQAQAPAPAQVQAQAQAQVQAQAPAQVQAQAQAQVQAQAQAPAQALEVSSGAMISS